MDHTRNSPPALSGAAEHRKKIRTLLFAALAAAAMAAVCIFAWEPVTSLFADPEGFRKWVAEQGAWGPVLFVALMAFQIVVAVLPGEPLEIAAGYTFGVWGGTALCMAGALVGSVAVFLAVRAWGRRALELFFPRKKIDSLAFLRDERKLHSLVFLLFLIPGTPKDIMTYAVGLTRMQLPAWLLISTFARIPSILTSTAGGDALNLQNYEFALLVFAATLLISGAGLLLYRGLCRARRKEEKP